MAPFQRQMSMYRKYCARIINSSIKQIKFHLLNAIFGRVNLFAYVIYSPPNAHAGFEAHYEKHYMPVSFIHCQVQTVSRRIHNIGK